VSRYDGLHAWTEGGKKRQKSRGQKARMIEGKKHRARIKSKRRGGFED
jgi:hypothetical protein